MQSPCAVIAINTFILCVTSSWEIVIKLSQNNNETALLRVLSNSYCNNDSDSKLYSIKNAPEYLAQ